MENKKNDWRQIVGINGNPEAAVECLAKQVTGNAEAFKGVDLDTIHDKFEYITAVPIEIALTTDARHVLMKSTPEVRWIITGVTPESVKRMVNEYGYNLSEAPRLSDNREKKVDVSATKQTYRITSGDTTVEITANTDLSQEKVRDLMEVLSVICSSK